jgi:hypothetical protein
MAACVIEKVDYLLSWNCTHLGMVSYGKIYSYNENHGLWTPALVTPEVLIEIAGEEEYEIL